MSHWALSLILLLSLGSRARSLKIQREEEKRGLVQVTFLKPRKTGNSEKKGPPGKVRNTGRFQKRSIVSVDKTRPVTPSIPLNTRGLRRFLRQWVGADKEWGLLVPLAMFDLHQRNGKGATGKSNKFFYSKRRRLAVAVLLSLQDAFENSISFSVTIGHDKKEKSLESIPISEWDNIAAST